MDTHRKKLSTLTLKLQSQTHIPLWALANERVIYSIAIKNKSPWGRRSKILRQFVNIAYKIKLANITIFCVGLLRAFRLYWSTYPKILPRELRVYKEIFAGFGAAPEEYMYENFKNQTKTPSLRINWVTHSGMNKLRRPSLFLILLHLARCSFGHTAKLKNASPEISSNIVDFLTVCALNVGIYAFYRSYWRMAKKYGIEKVTFITPDILVFACVDENIKTIYLQHGLLALSILFPEVDRIDTITADEERYLKAILKKTNIFILPKNINASSIKNDVLFILSPNLYMKNRASILKSLVDWSLKAKLKIIIRSTPTATQEELSALKDLFPDFILDDTSIPLNTRIEQLNPKLIASVNSTGLATALDYKCLPISLSDPLVDDANATLNMIYPMKSRVLFWPQDKILLETALQSEKSYHSQLQALSSTE